METLRPKIYRRGARRQHAVHVCFYVTDMTCGRDCLQADNECFKNSRPAMTMLEDKDPARVDRRLEMAVEADAGWYLTSRLT